MIEFLEQATFWHWMILGVALVVVEMILPGVVFMWMGIAAGITGFVVIAFPQLGWEGQLIVFACFSVISVVGGRIWISKRPTETDHPTLNRRGEQYVGRHFTLEEPIINGVGKLRVDDTTWKITGDDLAAGTAVAVVSADGVILRVEKRA
jgi:inner membrane protein